MNPPQSDGFPLWGKVSIALALFTTLWSFAKNFFGLVGRREIAELLMAQQTERLRLHAELQSQLTDLFNRMSSLEQRVARIEGSLTGRVRALEDRGRNDS